MTKVLTEAKWTAATRKAHKASGGYFAGPDDTFPLKDASDVADAWGLAGHADNPDQVRANIKRWAKQHGHYDALPDTAKDDDDGEKQESAATVASSDVRPKKKIATLKVCFLEDNARSLNGRIYPKATVDRIVASAIRKLADPDALPVTCFVSHETANTNANTELVGRVTKVWREGSKIYATIDLADTRVARDMLALAEGGYLQSESMRVLGVELAHDRAYDLPLVVVQEGQEPELLGIDLTTRPGLMDTARIQQVLYESSQQAPYSEDFHLDTVLIESKEAPMSVPIYLQVIAGTLQEGMTADRAAHQRIHDHLAGVMDSAVKECHGNESAGFKALVEGQLDEAGRAIAQKHAVVIAAAHDEAARQCGMECEGCYKEALGVPLDPDRDGDSIGHDTDNDNESQKGDNTMMTEEQMLQELKAKGYAVTAPKTVQEELQELRDKLKVLEESRITEAPQRQTQAPSAMSEQASDYREEELYEEGDYLKGPLHPRNWRALANPKVPWPKEVDPLAALKELAPFLAYRLNEDEARARGRSIDMYIGEYEQV